jgi:hypothetical protein
MLDLKPYYDAVLAAEADVQRVANEIDTNFRDGTEEGKAKALALRPALDEAQNKLTEATNFYEAMKNTTRPNDVVKNFVPVSNTSTEEAPGSQTTVIKRQDYDKLDLVNRAKFVKSGGKIED